MENFWKKSRGLISRGKLSEALKLIRKNINGELLNEIILYQIRLTNLQKKQRLFEDNESDSELLKLYKTVLDFISERERKPITEIPKGNDDDRVVQLKYRVKKTYQLLEQWEDKLTISENPNEHRRSQMEIERLEGIIKKYLKELSQLEEH